MYTHILKIDPIYAGPRGLIYLLLYITISSLRFLDPGWAVERGRGWKGGVGCVEAEGKWGGLEYRDGCRARRRGKRRGGKWRRGREKQIKRWGGKGRGACAGTPRIPFEVR